MVLSSPHLTMASPGAKTTYSADSTEADGGGPDDAAATEHGSTSRPSSPIKPPRLVAGLLPRSASKNKPAAAGYNDEPGETLETYVLPPKLRMDQGGDDTAGLEVIKVSKVRRITA